MDPTRNVTSTPAEEPRLIDGRPGTEPVPAPALVLDLVEIPADRVKGIYTIGGVPGLLPRRALYVHPDAVDDFLEMADAGAVVSDLFRSPESSLAAVQSGRGALQPGRSAHGFGLATDFDVAKTMKALRLATKQALDDFAAAHGFYCHRRDHKITPLKGEGHHFNHLGDALGAYAVRPNEASTAPAIERRIESLYGHAWRDIDLTVAQAQLARLGLYRGDLDGKLGPISKAAVRVFRRGWGLGDSDRIDARTFRTLVYVAAGRRISRLSM